MGAQTVNQTYSCIMPTSLPASVFSNDDVIGVLSGMPPAVMNDAIGSVLSADFFVRSNLQITASSVSGARWINYNGKAALVYILNVTSDPVTASDIVAVLVIAGVLIIAALSALGAIATVDPGLLILGLIFGSLIFLSPSVQLIAQTVADLGSGLGSVLKGIGAAVSATAPYAPILIAAGLGVFAYSYLSDEGLRKDVTKRIRSSVRS